MERTTANRTKVNYQTEFDLFNLSSLESVVLYLKQQEEGYSYLSSFFTHGAEGPAHNYPYPPLRTQREMVHDLYLQLAVTESSYLTQRDIM